MGFTPLRGALSQLHFRDRYGMPFASAVKPRMSASSRACRAVIAARQQWPGSEWKVFRALQLANFNSPFLFDDDDQMREVLGAVPGVDADDDRRADRLARGARGLRARQGADPHRGGLADRAPGQGRQQRRQGSLHGAVGRVRDRRRPAAGGRRLPAGRGLRRADRQPRPDADAQGAAGGSRHRCWSTSSSG